MTTTTRTTTRRRGARAAALPLALALALGAAACGGEEEEVPESVDVAEEVGADDAEDALADDADDALPGEGAAAEAVVGLEVTFVGDVTEVLDEQGFRVDKDGVETEEQAEADVYGDDGYYDEFYDYDYTDSDYLTEYDDELGETAAADRGVVVVAPGGTSVALSDDVRVSGTLRLLDLEGLEDAYEVELDETVYGDQEQRLVVVASSVSPADQVGPGSSSGATATPTPTAGG